MRLAHIHNVNGPGGGTVSAQNLLEEWHEHGIEAWAVHAANTNYAETFVSEELEYPVMYPSRLEDGLRELDPDIVFVHGFSPALNEQLRGLAESDDFDAVFVLRKGMNLLEAWLGRAADRAISQVRELGWYDCVICPTEAASERMSLMYGGGCPRLAYVPNGIDREAYVPTSFMQDGFLRVITVSRLAPNNFLLSPLLAVMAALQDEMFPVKLDIFGPANNAAANMVRSLAEGFEDISVHGKVEHDALREQLEQADVVCVPSMSHQAVPLAAVEGMAAGNVVLGSFYEAHEEDAIVYVPAAHPPTWLEVLSDIYDDPDDAREHVTDSIERAAAYDVSGVVADGYLPVFEDLLDDADT